jgi:signal transduction histidine kinase
MNFKNEKQLLFVIKYSPLIFIIILSIIITTFLYFENKNVFEKIKKNTEEKYIVDRKQIIKEQVNNAYEYIISEQKDTEKNLKESLHSRILETHKIITNIYNQYKNTHSKEEITLLVKTAIKDIRFNNNRGYFFVYDKTATNVIHPLVPSFEGKNLINYQDSRGVYTLQETLKLLEDNDESFYDWYWRKSKTDMNDYRKIGFVKNIYELDWFIGTGEYVDEFSQDIQKKVLAQIDKFRFGKNSYFIVTDKDNNYLSHINKDLIGQNAFDKLKSVSDINNLEHIKEVIKKGEGYVYLKFFKPSSNIPTFKIIYLKYVPEWDWILSTGFYQDDVDILINKEKDILTERYENNLKNLFIFSFISTLLLLGLSFYISFIIERRFKNYKKSIQHHISENQKQHELLAQKSKLAAMGEMMENIAHQWRQPLSLIRTASSGIKFQKDMDILTDNSLLDAVDSISTSAKYLSETIDDFRDFFKPDKERVVFDLNLSIEKTLKLLSSQIKNKEIIISLNTQDIEVDNFERELLQVLLNILKNAIDALELKEGKKYIFINISKDEEYAIIQIKDNAGGIPSEIIERIFEPYFTTKHQSQGTGIGLYMSQEIISRHMDGILSVENCLYKYEKSTFKGAKFTIKLPLD